MVGRYTPALTLSGDQRGRIEGWLSAHGTPQQVALRCRIVLAAAEGRADLAIARELSVNRHTATLWRRRFAEDGLDCLWEVAAGRGRKPTYGVDQVKGLVDA